MTKNRGFSEFNRGNGDVVLESAGAEADERDEAFGKIWSEAFLDYGSDFIDGDVFPKAVAGYQKNSGSEWKLKFDGKGFAGAEKGFSELASGEMMFLIVREEPSFGVADAGAEN